MLDISIQLPQAAQAINFETSGSLAGFKKSKEHPVAERELTGAGPSPECRGRAWRIACRAHWPNDTAVAMHCLTCHSKHPVSFTMGIQDISTFGYDEGRSAK